MKLVKILVKFIIVSVLCMLLYLLSAFLIGKITINSSSNDVHKSQKVYLTTNGIHLSIVIAKQDLTSDILKGLNFTSERYQYIMFGWGNKDFYINTPTWDDVKFKYVFDAMFLNTPTAIHLTTYPYKQKDWVEVSCNDLELFKLNQFILQTFKLQKDGSKIRIPCTTYGVNDFFYAANGNYSFRSTCNTWANEAFKTSGLKSSYWTIFDFGLLEKYE